MIFPTVRIKIFKRPFALLKKVYRADVEKVSEGYNYTERFIALMLL